VSDAATPRVLVAADRMALSAIRQALEDEFEVVAAGPGLDAFEQAANGDIACIILDLKLRGLDGFDVCRRLKAMPRTASIPVLFLTINDRVDEAPGFGVGAADYLWLPIKASLVRARVRAQVELKELREQLEQLALVDPLTGVANRTRFDTALDNEWRRMARAGRWLSIAVVEVDYLKRIIERQGQPAGDERLKTIAGSLARSARRAGDLVARFSAEEFAIILPEIEPQMMQGMLRVIMTGVVADAARADAGQRIDPVTVSIGGAGTREDDRRRARRRRSLTRRSQARRPRPRRAPRSRFARQDGRPPRLNFVSVSDPGSDTVSDPRSWLCCRIDPSPWVSPRFIPSSRSGSRKHSARRRWRKRRAGPRFASAGTR
jgi:diguanylate cyclase (GGDEF)-like protein